MNNPGKSQRVSTVSTISVSGEPEHSSKVRVLLVEDHPITRQGLKALVNQQLNLEVCGETDSATDAVELVAQLRPNIVVADVSLKNASGLDLTKLLKERYPELPVLVVSMHDEALFAERALRAGAMGYVMKQEAGEKIVTAIQQLIRGELYLSNKMKERVLHRFVSKKSDGMVFAMDTLSHREMEVFQLIGNGYSTRQIAEKLNLSSKTIDSYREHLKLKLGLDSGADLMRHAIQWARAEVAV
ncbi:response regulator transcription factor [Opitutus sp. ER46]|uniref:response regulator transcription factor n=1 Tax=Opitutus sp. ER46 TaxID=2161864 RepID=UPI000D31EC2C|nr:response regulator transcription factor [Opitutus sp. ER46]PTX92682.1 DNA-binding response regulator [Opitutus sp. ER46]